MGSVGLELTGYLPTTQTALFRTPDNLYYVRCVMTLFCEGAGPETVELWLSNDAYPTPRKCGQFVMQSQLPTVEADFSPGFKSSDTLWAATTNGSTVAYSIQIVAQPPDQV